MMEKLRTCIEELSKNYVKSDITQGLREYTQIIENIAKTYTDNTTIQEVRHSYSELDFMDEEGIKEILRAAKEMRHFAEKYFSVQITRKINPSKKEYKYILLRVQKNNRYDFAGSFKADIRPAKLLREFHKYVKQERKKEIAELAKEFGIF